MPEEKRATLPFYSPRIWHGMTSGAWFPLLSRSRFAVAPTLIPLASGVSMASIVNSGLRLCSEFLYGRKAENTELKAPLFVIGHWRTGTTLLHELLVRDERFTYPNTYQCMAPAHFLLTARFLGPIIDRLMPNKRPMDNMAVGWRRPQEDEFALMNLGIGSNYCDWAFPNLEIDYDRFLTLEDVSVEESEAWKKAFVWFLRRLTVYDDRQVVLKSPTHTARISTLLDIFPDAKFLHIVRDPRNVLPSTVRTWTRMTDALAFQRRNVEFSVQGRVEVFKKMYDRFFKERELLRPEQFHELRYEELIENPLEVLQRAYDTLSLGSFDSAREKVQEYLDSTRDFKGNNHELPAKTEQEITSGCRPYMEEYGYL